MSGFKSTVHCHKCMNTARVLDIVQCYALHNAVNEKVINITIFFSTLRVSCELRTLTLRACQKLYSACCIQGEGNYTYVVNKSMN